MDTVPYTFRPAKFQHSNQKGYWVTLFLFFDGTTTHTFYHLSEMMENYCLAKECGVDCYNFNRDILVTKDVFSNIFQEIEDYVSLSYSD